MKLGEAVIEAGAVCFAMSYRPLMADQGVCIQVAGRVDGQPKELLRFDCFDHNPHYHYDPEGKSTQMTKEEIERMKDPILFGVFKGSRRLFYITDWIDEYCDLTLDDVTKVVPIFELTESPEEVKKVQESIEKDI